LGDTIKHLGLFYALRGVLVFSKDGEPTRYPPKSTAGFKAHGGHHIGFFTFFSDAPTRFFFLSARDGTLLGLSQAIFIC